MDEVKLQDKWEAIGDIDFTIHDILKEPQQRLVRKLRCLGRESGMNTVALRTPEVPSGHGSIEIYATKVCPDHNKPNRAIIVDINFDELDLLDSAQVLPLLRF